MPHTKKLTILHSNDMHGDFLAENVDQKLVGGVSRLSGYLSKVRRQEENVIYAIAGDMFRGSVIDSEFKGISTIEIMNYLSPDVVSLGNHEIDYGITHLLFIEKCATFPIINANLYIRTNHAHLFRSHIVLEVGGMKVLFIGIITDSILDATRSDNLVGSFIDLREAAAEIGAICDTYNSIDIDFTVLLTHIGIEEDKKLAAMLDPVWGVDIIIGGHSHTLLDQPEVINGIPIVQAGTGTDQIGRFDIVVDTDNNKIDSYQWHCLPINETNCPRDIQLEKLLTSYTDVTDKKYNRILTRFKRVLTHPRRNQETELGDLFCDILTECLGVDIMFLGSGSIRTESLGEVVTFGSLCEAFPYDDKVEMLTVTGAQLRHALTFLLREEAFAGTTEFYQLPAAVSLTYDRAQKKITALTFKGRPVQDKDLFTVGFQEYHYTNIDRFFDLDVSQLKTNGPSRTLSTGVIDILSEYLVNHQHLDVKAGRRIIIAE